MAVLIRSGGATQTRLVDLPLIMRSGMPQCPEAGTSVENASGRRNGISPGRDAPLASYCWWSFAALAGSGDLELLVAEVGDELEGAT
jgi:hypothetical protein